MTQCRNCEKPAMFGVGEKGDMPVCLDCYAKLVHTMDVQNAQNERWLNYLSDEMDAMVGMGRMGPRFPERKPPVQISNPTFHSINVKDSTVGMINTGALTQVDSAVTIIKQSDAQLAEAFKTLIEAVMNSAALKDEAKQEAVEILGTLSVDATQPPGQRKRALAGLLMGRLRELLSLSADVAQVTQVVWPYIQAAFG